MENKNLIIGGGVVLAILYFMSKKKKPVSATEEATDELPSPVGGGGGGGFFPILPQPQPQPQPEPIVAKPPVRTKTNIGGCPAGYVPSGKDCVKPRQDAQSTTSGRAAYEESKKASAGLGVAPTTGGTGTTSGTTTGTGGSSGGLSGSGAQNQPSPGTTPTGSPIYTTPTSGTTCPPNYSYNKFIRKCVKEITGQTSMRFSGKEPLTLDNLLM